VTVGLRAVVAPAVALAAVAALGLRGPAAWAGVMQSAMPTALAATVLVAQHRCDAALASAACALGMALAPLTLTAWAVVAERLL
jgi:predicted permease